MQKRIADAQGELHAMGSGHETMEAHGSAPRLMASSNMTVDPQELEPERSGWSGDYISGDVLHPPGWDNPEFSDAPQPLSPEVLARVAHDAEIARNEAARMSESSTVQARGAGA